MVSLVRAGSTGMVREAIVRTELTELTKELADLNKYRDYYEGDQLISFGTTKFKERFGDAFKGFRDNWCLPTGSPVVVDSGVVAIDSLVPGDFVYTHDGDLREVQKVVYREVDEDLIGLKVFGSPKHRMTAEHPVLVTKQKSLTSITTKYADDRHFALYGTGANLSYEVGSIERIWVRADQIEVGDIIWSQVPSAESNTASVDLARLLGWYVSEGSVSDNGRIAFSLHEDETEYQDEVEQLLGSVFGAKHVTRVATTGRCIQVVFYSKAWARWLETHCGRGSGGKHFPDNWTGERFAIESLIRAFWGDGSGGIVTRALVSYTSVSLALVTQMQMILLRYGIASSWCVKEQTDSRQKTHTLTISGKDRNRLANILGWAAYEFAYTKAASQVLINGWIGSAVSKVENVPYSGSVWDLQVADSHSFLLPGMFAVHNCEVVIDAVADKLEVTGIRVGRSPEDIEAWRGLSEYLWERFLDVDIDDKQSLLHTGVFVEGRSTAIIWPDAKTGFTINWNPAQIVRVRYDDDNPDRIAWAVKRWQTPTGAIYVTYYTPEAVFKYVESEGEDETTRSDKNITPLDSIPDVDGSTGLARRLVPGEKWPLPNPFGEVPVVEFPNKSGNSEIKNVVPMQDAVNYVIQQMFVAGEFNAFRQKAMVTKQAAPEGGWSNDPGKVWQFEPMVDAEGKMQMPVFHEFDVSDPSSYIKIVEMFLQHISMTTKTPMRMFMQDSRGGRGDAPSGESLKVEDKPLLDKVRKRSKVLGNRWYRMIRLGYKALLSEGRFRIEIEGLIPEGASRVPYGEVRWRDDRVEYRAAAIAEAKSLIDIGWPRVLAWKHAGFSPEEIKEAEKELEKQEQADFEKQQKEMELRAEQMGNEPGDESGDESGDGITRPKQDRSGPRPTVQ